MLTAIRLSVGGSAWVGSMVGKEHALGMAIVSGVQMTKTCIGAVVFGNVDPEWKAYWLVHVPTRRVVGQYNKAIEAVQHARKKEK